MNEITNVTKYKCSECKEEFDNMDTAATHECTITVKGGFYISKNGKYVRGTIYNENSEDHADYAMDEDELLDGGYAVTDIRFVPIEIKVSLRKLFKTTEVNK
ncbi:MAG: hypothetical protein KKD44_28225 [Proteobacteria bacterium]|nr:hypothetical protein [Pseudomonadota bacterium]